MDDYTVKRLALVLALQAEMEAMKVFNIARQMNGEQLGYGEDDFLELVKDFGSLANKHNEQL